MALTQVSSGLLANTAVTAGTYGGSTAIPVIAVNAQGQITSASNTTVSIPATVAQGNGAIIVTTTTISTNYTIPSANNGFSVGPVTIAPGDAVTLTAGQRWIII